MKLTINKYSNSGLEPELECYGGRINVFRSYDKSAAEIYANALCDLGQSQFKINIDDRAVRPEEVSYVGFKDQRTNAELNCTEFFTKFGSSTKEAQRILSSHGLSAISLTSIKDLQNSQWRMIELLRATLTTNNLLILNDPFLDFSPESLEHFAMLLGDYARRTGSVIIITKLSQRPESWIDNPDVNRIVIDNEVESTIGQGNSVQILLRQARDGRSQEFISRSTTQSFFRNSKLERIILNAGFSVFSFILVALLSFIATSEDKVKASEIQSTKIQSTEIITLADKPIVWPNISNSPPERTNSNQKTTELGIHEPLVLARYSEKIEASIRSAFAGVDTVAAPIPEKSVLEDQQISETVSDSNREMKKKTSELLIMLQSASGKEEKKTSANLNINSEAQTNFAHPIEDQVIINDQQSQEDWEQRREEMRMRFLQAIAQANQP